MSSNVDAVAGTSGTESSTSDAARMLAAALEGREVASTEGSVTKSGKEPANPTLDLSRLAAEVSRLEREKREAEARAQEAEAALAARDTSPVVIDPRTYADLLDTRYPVGPPVSADIYPHLFPLYHERVYASLTASKKLVSRDEYHVLYAGCYYLDAYIESFKDVLLGDLPETEVSPTSRYLRELAECLERTSKLFRERLALLRLKESDLGSDKQLVAHVHDQLYGKAAIEEISVGKDSNAYTWLADFLKQRDFHSLKAAAQASANSRFPKRAQPLQEPQAADKGAAKRAEKGKDKV